MTNFDMRNDDRATASPDAKRIIFMGTGFFALPLLEVLMAEKELIEVVGVVTKPDAKVGRGDRGDRSVHTNPIKDATLSRGVHLTQPEKITDDVIATLSAMRPDLIIVASYGKILPQALLDIAPLGAINIHASLLPKFRGASPIQNALLLGEQETGITIIQMNAGLDAGDILTTATIPIGPEDTAPTLQDALATLGARTTLEILPQLLDGTLTSTPQDESLVTLCQLIDRADGRVTWLANAQEILNRYRAFTPWPGLFTFWQKESAELVRVKLLDISLYTGALDLSAIPVSSVFVDESQLCVRVIDGAIVINELQREGKASQTAQVFLNGNKDIVGATLV